MKTKTGILALFLALLTFASAFAGLSQIESTDARSNGLPFIASTNAA